MFSGEVKNEGYLSKKSSMGSLQSRYFRVNKSCLQYYTDSTASAKIENLKGAFELKDFQSIVQESCTLTCSMANGRQLILAAQSSEAAAVWKDALGGTASTSGGEQDNQDSPNESTGGEYEARPRSDSESARDMQQRMLQKRSDNISRRNLKLPAGVAEKVEESEEDGNEDSDEDGDEDGDGGAASLSDTKVNIKAILRLVDEHERNSAAVAGCSTVLVIGNTGVGKSTVSAWTVLQRSHTTNCNNNCLAVYQLFVRQEGRAKKISDCSVWGQGHGDVRGRQNCS
jgi:hypothetical protein